VAARALSLPVGDAVADAVRVSVGSVRANVRELDVSAGAGALSQLEADELQQRASGHAHASALARLLSVGANCSDGGCAVGMDVKIEGCR